MSEIEFLDIAGVVRGTFVSGSNQFKSNVINAIRATFINKRVDQGSVSLSTFLVVEISSGSPRSVSGRIIPDARNNRTTFQLFGDSPEQKFFGIGKYQVTLLGDKDPAGNVIMAMDGSRLDGEPNLPSGDGTEGGDFVFTFEIVP